MSDTHVARCTHDISHHMMYDRDAELVIIQQAKGLRTTLNIDDKLLAEA